MVAAQLHYADFAQNRVSFPLVGRLHELQSTLKSISVAFGLENGGKSTLANFCLKRVMIGGVFFFKGFLTRIFDYFEGVGLGSESHCVKEVTWFGTDCLV